MAKLGVAVLVVGGLMLIGTCAGNDTTSSGDGSGAEDACKSWVTDELKAPSTADFSGVSTSGDGPWVITGNVDAQNGFGAQIRSGWICDVKLIGSTYRGNASLLE